MQKCIVINILLRCSPIEYVQLLSTVHRVLDGTEYIGTTKTGRKAKRYRLDDDREDILYKASHIKH